MTVEFLLSTTQPKPEVAEMYGQLIESVRQQMEVPDEAIEIVVIADPPNFGEAVGRYDPGKGYTNANGLLAVGKTMVIRGTNPRRSAVLLMEGPVTQAVMAAVKNGPDVSKWEVEDQRSLYVLFHELAHVMDHYTRPDLNYDGTFRDSDGRRMTRVNLRDECAYNLSTVLPELAASVLSGLAYPDCVRALDLDMNNQAVETLSSELIRKSNGPERELESIRREALGLVTFVLMQQAKLVGAELGNPKGTPVAITDAWKCARCSDDIRQGIESASLIFRDAWMTYPEWDGHALTDRMLPVLEQLAAGFGYSFRDEQNRDGVWWNALRRDMLGIALRLP